MIRNFDLYPLKFEPILKSLIWGGRRLGDLLGKPIGDGSTYAESWEVSDHREDVSRVANGPLRGASLRDLLRDHNQAILGSALPHHDQFPLLVKFLDAHQVLSVQVHPDDAVGRRLVNDNGKTEAWVIMDSDPGSLIYAGLNQGVTRSDFEAAITDGRVEPLLHAFHPEPGDCIFIPAGTVHAIGAGIVLAEIQQMSDATFRVDDWGRLGADGKPRQLHIAESLEATNYTAGPVDPVHVIKQSIACGTRERLITSPYFALERLTLSGPATIGLADRFSLVLGLSGSATIEHAGQSTPLLFGETALLPAAIGTCQIQPSNTESITILTCVVP